MKYFTLLIFSLFLFSCSKEKKKVTINKGQDSAKIFFNKYKSNQDKNVLGNETNLDKSFSLLKDQNNELSTRNLLSNIVVEFYTNNNDEKLNKSSRLLLQLSLDSNDSINLGMAYRSRGNYYFKIQKLDSSYYCYVQAEKIYDNLKDDKNYSNILMNKGIIQYSIGDYLGAELSLNKANTLFKKENNYNKIYGSLDQLGLVATELKEYDKAFFYFNKALEAINNLPLEEDKIYYTTICKNNIGYLYLKSREYKKAVYYFEEALQNKLIKNDDPLLYSNLIDNLAYCRLKSNSLKNLPSLFFEALKIRENLDDYTVVVGSYIHLSEYYFYKNDLKNAILFSKKAIEISKKSKIPSNLVLALKQASFIDKINASKYTEEYIRISDSLQIVERNSKDRFARIQLETDELRQENFNLEEKNRNILNYFFGTVLFIGVLFFIRTQRSRARVLALKQAQQQANEEIYRLIISHQNQLELGKDLEKKRLSKELHDGVLGRLFGLRLSLDGLNSFDDEQAKKERLEYLNELQLIEQDLREISHELNRETSLLINNFVAIINSLIEQQAKVNNANIKVIIDETIDWDKISNIIKINLYRILQEALQNINKHALAKNVSVHFRKDSKENLLFNIEDDGKGFDTNIKKNKGIGTKNMVSRVHQCNGSIDIKSEIGKGSKIIIIFPLENSNFKV